MRGSRITEVKAVFGGDHKYLRVGRKSDIYSFPLPLRWLAEIDVSRRCV